MIEIERTYTFEAAHYLPGAPDGHKCKNMHGHSYTVTIGLRSESWPMTPGWLVDFGDIDVTCAPLVKSAPVSARALGRCSASIAPANSRLAGDGAIPQQLVVDAVEKRFEARVDDVG